VSALLVNPHGIVNVSTVHGLHAVSLVWIVIGAEMLIALLFLVQVLE
jgi:hypothetical protein